LCNIKNINTTKTIDGGPFIRNKIIVLNGEGIITKDNKTETKLKYEPYHPDAMITGSRKGYVEYPNIDIFSELVDLILVTSIIENIIEECDKKNIKFPVKYIDISINNNDKINSILNTLE
jgi:flagellar basal-body rod protein FlgC